MHCERDKKPEIEVTPEMIEAGIDELTAHYPLDDASEFPEIVRTVYAAMEGVRRKSGIAGSQKTEQRL